jgi:hypothetical protein
MTRRLAALVLALPLVAAAQAAPPSSPPAAAPTAPAEASAPTPPARAAQAPAGPPAAPAPAPTSAAKPAVTVDLSGWLVTQAFHNFGGVNASDLPQWAAHGVDTGGIAVRQSRIRAALGLPSDGLLADARLKGLLELDFLGGNSASTDASLPTARLRHAYLTVGWSDWCNRTLLVGQTWGVFTGPYFATSLGHLAVPRFGGAGFLYRRAPQVRLTSETKGSDLALQTTFAALAPVDKSTSQGFLVGERSSVPDVEGRVAALVRRGGKTVLELAGSGRFGQQKWQLDGLSSKREKRLSSWGAAVDARIELPMLTLVGAAWTGQALGVYYSVAPGVKTVANATTATLLDNVSPVRSMGAWGQAILAPTSILQLVAGYGVEAPRRKDLPAGTAAAPTVTHNQQVSGGAILSLTSRWKVSGEVTWYDTTTYDHFKRNATQLELASLYAF